MSTSERTSLLPSASPTTCRNIRELLFRDELGHLTTLALPVIVTYFLEYLPGMVSIMLVGHLDAGPASETILDGISFAVMFLNLTGLSIGFGLATVSPKISPK